MEMIKLIAVPFFIQTRDGEATVKGESIGVLNKITLVKLLCIQV